MNRLFTIFFLFTVLQACGNKAQQENQAGQQEPVPPTTTGQTASLINPSGMTVESRFDTPTGFQRVEMPDGSFGAYLRQLLLKPDGAEVRYYNGETKHNSGIYVAVVDMGIGNKDLHQCADAVMRFRAEYLWNEKKYHKIHFNFVNGHRVDYSEWRKGKRIRVRGNRSWWVQAAQPSDAYEDFWKYMETIFMYAGTLSLEREMKPEPVEEMKIGDVFIYGGSPGHAVIVVDMAENPQTGEKVFMLAQSYMPAQETQILANPADGEISPWYPVNFGKRLITPEWTFDRSALRRFEE